MGSEGKVVEAVELERCKGLCGREKELLAQRDRLVEALEDCQAALVQVAPPYTDRMRQIIEEAVEHSRRVLADLYREDPSSLSLPSPGDDKSKPTKEE